MTTFDQYLSEAAKKWERIEQGGYHHLVNGEKRLSAITCLSINSYQEWVKENHWRWLGLSRPTEDDFNWLAKNTLEYDDDSLLSILHDSRGRELKFNDTKDGLVLMSPATFANKFKWEQYPWLSKLTKSYADIRIEFCDITDLHGLNNVKQFKDIYLEECRALTSLHGLEQAVGINDLRIRACENLTNIDAIVHDWDDFKALEFIKVNRIEFIKRFKEPFKKLLERGIEIEMNHTSVYLSNGEVVYDHF